MSDKSWLQIRGDPAVRNFVFEQERVPSEFDIHLDEVLAQARELLIERGAFHIKLHFSSGQVTVWLIEDPLRYRVFVKEEFLRLDFCTAFAARPYTALAVIPPEAIPRLVGELGRLRVEDDHIYLRSGSINIVNGLIGLNFSCDGTHYLGYADFLEKAPVLYRAA